MVDMGVPDIVRAHLGVWAFPLHDEPGCLVVT